METFVHLDLSMPLVDLDQHSRQVAVLDASRFSGTWTDPGCLVIQKDSLELQVELVVPLELDTVVE